MLKQRTAHSHDTVEGVLALLDPGLTTSRLAVVLQHLHAFWAATEPVLDAWAEADGAPLAARLQWNRRRRSHRFATDLDALGVAPLAPPAPVFVTADDAAALGWLYVVEGSTLGGVLIGRRLEPLLAAAGISLHSFTPYAEGPGPMWRDYGAVLDEWAALSPERPGRVADTAFEAFSALEQWVAPLQEGAAA